MADNTSQSDEHSLTEDHTASRSGLGGVLQYLYAAALGSYLCGAITEPDFYFHLLNGRWISAHRTLPTTDIWTSALKGQRWYSESWLFDFLLSSTEDRFGWTGLAVFKIGLCILFVVALTSVLSRISGSRFFGGVLATVVACGTLEQAPFGPELFAYPLFTLLVGTALFARERSRLTSFEWVSVALCTLFLANAHASFFLLLCCAVLFGLKDPAKTVWMIVLLLCAALFVTPYAGSQIPFLATSLFARGRFYLQSQGGAATVFDYSFSFLLLLWFLAAFIGLAKRDSRRLPAELLLAGAVSLIALAVKFLLPFALILTGLVCAGVWASARLETRPKEIVVSFERLEQSLLRLPAVGVAWILFCVLVVNSANFVRRPSVDLLLPKLALDYVLERKLPFPLWNESAVGPYVMYRLADERGEPRELTAVDPRAVPEHSEIFFEESKGLWKASFSRVMPHTILVRANTGLYESLAANPSFHLVFQAGEEVLPAERQNKVEKPPFYAWAVFTDANLEPKSAL
ncbi:MAG: hypothetical protein U0136_10265 [Bdellovibrionota bacterium]